MASGILDSNFDHPIWGKEILTSSAADDCDYKKTTKV